MNEKQRELLIALENLWRMYPSFDFGKILAILTVDYGIGNLLFYSTTEDWIEKLNLIREDALKLKIQLG
jgi:hypothetical protein